jgi:tRNA 2-selenouridine synthase
MSLEVTDDVSAAALARYDLIIDVRSPAEFAEDHVPGAVNLPVLSNEERAEIGTVYVQVSRFQARRMGAAYVARNVAAHLETALSDRDGSFRPFIYCWRGGMRSRAMATIFDQIGWRTTVLMGGYHRYRRAVIARIYDGELPHRFLLLDGATGVGKTAVLGLLAERGVQTLDLEALAEHRGSLLGGLGRPQPGQRLFESRLLAALDRLDPDRVVVAEAESSKIGDRMIPPALWTRLTAASRIELAAATEARAAYLVKAYADIIADRPALDRALVRLPVRVSATRRAAWRKMVETGAFEELALALMAHHYDPAYVRARKKHARPLLAEVALDPGDPGSLAAAADAVASEVSSLDGEDVGREALRR